MRGYRIGFYTILLIILGTGLSSAQTATSFTDLSNGMTAPDMVSNRPIINFGNCTFYNDLAAFQAGCGTFPIEDFEGSDLGKSLAINCGTPVDNTSTNTCFSTGDLIDGFSISASLTSGLSVIGTGLVPVLTSNAIAADVFAANTIITFDANDITAVAFDLMSAQNAGNIQVEIYDLSNMLVGSSGVMINTTSSTHIAMSVSDPISRIVLNGGGGVLGEAIDNLTFGTCQTIPTMNQWMLFILGLLTASLGLVFIVDKSSSSSQA